MEKRKWRVFLFIAIVIYALTGCVPTLKNIPSQNIVMRTFQGNRELRILIEKGYLDEKNRGLTWMTEEEYEKVMKD